jgi:hypothetical protein
VLTLGNDKKIADAVRDLSNEVDPGCAWQFWRGGWLADEALGVGEVGGVQDLGARADGRGVAVNVGGGAQLRLGVRVVVRHVRAGVGLDNAQVSEQQRDGLGGHGAAAVGVDGQLAAGDALRRSPPACVGSPFGSLRPSLVHADAAANRPLRALGSLC